MNKETKKFLEKIAERNLPKGEDCPHGYADCVGCGDCPLNQYFNIKKERVKK